MQIQFGGNNMSHSGEKKFGGGLHPAFERTLDYIPLSASENATYRKYEHGSPAADLQWAIMLAQEEFKNQPNSCPLKKRLVANAAIIHEEFTNYDDENDSYRSPMPNIHADILDITTDVIKDPS